MLFTAIIARRCHLHWAFSSMFDAILLFASFAATCAERTFLDSSECAVAKFAFSEGWKIGVDWLLLHRLHGHHLSRLWIHDHRLLDVNDLLLRHWRLHCHTSCHLWLHHWLHHRLHLWLHGRCVNRWLYGQVATAVVTEFGTDTTNFTALTALWIGLIRSADIYWHSNCLFRINDPFSVHIFKFNILLFSIAV